MDADSNARIMLYRLAEWAAAGWRAAAAEQGRELNAGCFLGYRMVAHAMANAPMAWEGHAFALCRLVATETTLCFG